jgi:hypothetical protein
MPAGALVLLAASALLACNVKSAPPRYPVAELTFSGKSKADLVDLIVSDRTRAARLRQIYLRIAALEYEFDLARERAIEQPFSSFANRSPAPAERVNAAQLERFLVPPLAESRAAFDRYVTLVLEARRQLREDEFERLKDRR